MKNIILMGCSVLILNTSSVLANEKGLDSWSHQWSDEWPKTNFNKTNIDLSEIMSGGPPKDGIPAIDNPIFKPIDAITNITEKEPVISLNIKNDARAYPIRILIYHVIVNDTVGDVPVSITYCPLCNASLTFERKVDDQILDFGTTGKLRLSDMVMYDRQTESWWQQFTGEGIVGDYTGKRLKLVPSRIESFALFKQRYPQGKVLVPNDPRIRDYGNNPYTSYDSSEWPFLFRGGYNGPIKPLSRVVAVGNNAWPLLLVQEKKLIKYQGLTIRWQQGQNSALDTRIISQGHDIGNVTVTQDGKEVVYHIPFAFAYLAFTPEGTIHTSINDHAQ